MISKPQLSPQEEGLLQKEYKGEPLHPDLAYGPLQKRGCKDVFFCLLFSLFWAGLIIIAGVALKTGEPTRLASPFDSSGNQCGYGAAEDYPLMFFSVNGQSLSSSNYACVKACPTTTNLSVSCLTNISVINCANLNTYDSTSFISVCVPSSSTLAGTLETFLNIGTAQEWMSDIKVTWPITLGTAFIAFTMSFIFLILLRMCAGVITWMMIIGYFAVLITLGIICIHKANTNDFQNVPSGFQSQNTLEFVGYAVLSVAGISLLLFLCFFNKIRRAVAIIKAASDFTREVWQAIIVPVIMFVLIAVFFVFWIVVSLYIFSSGTVSVNPNSPFGSVDWNDGVKRCLVYYLFGLFWNVEFFLGMSQLIVASCAGMWYFSHRPEGKLESPVARSIRWGFIHHIGSVCFGSLVLSIVILIKFFVDLVYHELKKSLQPNPAANCAVKCCLCCVRCFENFIRFISTNAYIMIALTGEGFCHSAKNAFFLVIRNAAQFSVTHGIGKLFVFFGKLFICVSSTLLGYMLMTNISKYSDNIYSSVAPTVLFGLVSFCIASVFMNIYGTAADTLLMCFCADKELNKGRAYSCPKAIQKFESDHMQ